MVSTVPPQPGFNVRVVAMPRNAPEAARDHVTTRFVIVSP
jgi:hypothetical protein